MFEKLLNFSNQWLLLKKILTSSFFKLLVAVLVVAALAYFNRIDWRGLLILRDTWGWLLLAFVLMFPPFLFVSYRFQIILKSQGLQVSFLQALRWTMIGSFFDLAMPSSSGGDIVKAGYVMKHSPDGMRTNAVMAVTLDRALGLLGLFVLTSVVVVAGWDKVRDFPGSHTLLVASLSITIGILIFFRILGARRLQNYSVFHRLIGKAGWGVYIQKFVASFNHLRERPQYLVQALLLSVINHSFWCLSLFCIAHAAGSLVTIEQGLVGFPIAIFGNIFGVAGGFGVGTAGFDLVLSKWMSIENGALIGLIFQTLSALARLAGLPFYVVGPQEKHRSSRSF